MRFPKLLLSACLCALLLVGVFGFVKAPVAHADVNGCPSGQNTLASADLHDAVFGGPDSRGKVFLCQDGITGIFFASYTVDTAGPGFTKPNAMFAELFAVGNDTAVATKDDISGTISELETGFVTASGEIKACGILSFALGAKWEGCTAFVSV
ncbi:MAG TPA: hypothetical protein VKP04_02180 [Ktedonobacteraceae bacterium]|nr:hypothetical protein [Ktedonobacteraceae bacterium]